MKIFKLISKMYKLINMIKILVMYPNIKIAKNVRLTGRFNISYDSMVEIGQNSRIDGLEIEGKGKVKIAENVIIKNLFINFDYSESNESLIEIGNDVFLGNGCKLIVFSHLSIGRGTLIAPEVLIVDTKHNFGHGIILRNSGVNTKSINIGDNVWIGAKSLILPGVNIVDNVIIAGSSVVNRNCEKNSIYAGNPAKKVKELF